jgi:hypothetical protein
MPLNKFSKENPMARQNALFTADSYANLVTAVNAFLATLPLANTTIHNFQIQVQNESRYAGLEIICNVVYDDAAGAPIANVFTIRADTRDNPQTLQADLNAIYAAAPLELFIPVATVQRKQSTGTSEYTVITLNNPLLAAGANVTFP